MAKTSLVCYEQNLDTNFYLCYHCRTHIALHEELLHKIFKRQYVETQENQHALLRDLVNVDVAVNYDINTGQAQVSCTTCDTNLGAKLVALQVETSAMRTGRYLINMKNLLFWNGRQILCADTKQPVPDA